jgi:hypothetical protein
VLGSFPSTIRYIHQSSVILRHWVPYAASKHFTSMVASRLWEVTNKGKEWAYGTGPTTDTAGTNAKDVTMRRPPPITTTPTTSNYSYMNYANKSFQFAADTTYSTLASVVSSLYKGGSTSSTPTASSSSQWLPSTVAAIHEFHVLVGQNMDHRRCR